MTLADELKELQGNLIGSIVDFNLLREFAKLIDKRLANLNESLIKRVEQIQA